MGYEPRPESKNILSQAWRWVQSVPYSVTARWVFYRLLQDGVYSGKKGYKHLLSLLSKARKEFYEEWRPWTLADDTRAPLLMQREGYYRIHIRGDGFDSEQEWRDTLKKELNCPLDRWAEQPVYVEIWFEAAAMQAQFEYYADENIPLLAFHGDVSIPEKWRAAARIAQQWLKHHKPIRIFYYGDLDEKGLIIPKSAWGDIGLWAVSLIHAYGEEDFDIRENLQFQRLGINQGQEIEFNIPENPERLGTYQWEALGDEEAAQLIKEPQEQLDIVAFGKVAELEREIESRLWGAK